MSVIQGNKTIKYLMAFIGAVCTSLTFFMIYEGGTTINISAGNRLYYQIYSIFEELSNACTGREFMLTLSGIGFLVFYLWFLSNQSLHAEIKLRRFLSAIFSIFGVAGNLFLKSAELSNAGQCLKVVIALVGGYIFYSTVIQIAYVFLERKYNFSVTCIPSKVRTFFWKNPFRVTFLVLLCCWAIPIILKYPAGICWDASWQIDQGMGNTKLTSHHPVFHTMLMAWFVQLGLKIGSANIGIFLFCVVEAIVLALIFSFAISVLVKYDAQKWSILFALLFFAFSPFITGYVGTVIKDVYFTAMVVLYVVLLYVYSVDWEDFWKKWYYPLLIIVASIGMVLFRNNGIYVCIPTGVVLLINEIRKRGRMALYRILIVILTCVLAFSSSKIVNYIFQPEKGSIAEALSIPFQQTARYVQEYGDEVTEEEKEAIEQILPYDQLAELYNPYISDPVKNEYNRSADTEDLKEYLAVWAKQLRKHPLCYVEAVFEQNVILLYPEYNNYVYYLDSNANHYVYTNTGYFHTPEVLQKIQILYNQVLRWGHTLPFLSLFNNMAAYIMAFLILIIFNLTKKRYSSIYYYAPVILSLLIIIAAPCIRWHVRYAFPIIYCFPILLVGFTIKGKTRE